MDLPRRPGFRSVPVRDRATIWVRDLNRRRLIAIAITVVIMVLVQGAVSRARSTVSQLGTRVEVPALTRPVSAGETLTSADIEVELWPVDVVPESRIAFDPVERIALVDLYAGEPVLEARLFPGSGWLKPNERLLTVPLPIAPPPVDVGDKVELFGVMAPDNPFGTQVVRLTTGTVAAVDETGVSVAVPDHRVTVVIEYLVLGVVEIVVVP